MSENYARHPLSALWGDISEEEYADMLESVREYGFSSPEISLLDGQVLDGWNRYQIGLELGLVGQLTFRQFAGPDPVAYVISQNSHRRHLSGSQRAAIVTACREWSPRGRPPSAGGKSELGSDFPGRTIFSG